jgi:hypothetical protein
LRNGLSVTPAIGAANTRLGKENWASCIKNGCDIFNESCC